MSLFGENVREGVSASGRQSRMAERPRFYPLKTARYLRDQQAARSSSLASAQGTYRGRISSGTWQNLQNSN